MATKMPTKTDMVNALLFGKPGSQDSPFEADLPGYAAHSAAKELATNWDEAIKLGTSLKTLVKDVDEVVQQLRAWKARLTSAV